MEGLVYGWKIYKDIEKKLKQEDGTGRNKMIEEKVMKGIREVLDGTEGKKKEHSKSGNNKSNVKKLISELRNIMTKKVGILRDAKGLKEAEEFVNLHLASEYPCCQMGDNRVHYKIIGG